MRDIIIVQKGLYERLIIFLKTWREPHGLWRRVAFVNYSFPQILFINGDRRWLLFGRTKNFERFLSDTIVHENLHLILRRISPLANNQLDNIDYHSVTLPSGKSDRYYVLKNKCIRA